MKVFSPEESVGARGARLGVWLRRAAFALWCVSLLLPAIWFPHGVLHTFVPETWMGYQAALWGSMPLLTLPMGLVANAVMLVHGAWLLPRFSARREHRSRVSAALRESAALRISAVLLAAVCAWSYLYPLHDRMIGPGGEFLIGSWGRALSFLVLAAGAALPDAAPSA